MQYQFKHNSGTVRWEKEGGAILQWRSHRFLGNSIKRLYEIVRRAGCCEECEGSRETSAGLDESSIFKKGVNSGKQRDKRTYRIVGYINVAELAVGPKETGTNQRRPNSSQNTNHTPRHALHKNLKLTSSTLIPIIHPIPNTHPANHHRTTDTE